MLICLNARLGLGGAQFMSIHLRPGGSLGVGWGDTVSRVIAATSFGAVGLVRMVSLTGGVPQIPKVVGVAGGLHKTEAILGALRDGFSTSWSPTSSPRSACSSWSAPRRKGPGCAALGAAA
jgi:DNA-binding transcriptional regulator LsrR (DeoR family)